MQMQNTCPKCGGKGHVHTENCPICKGKKVLMKKKELAAEIPAGAYHN